MTSLPVEKGEILLVEDAAGRFSLRAEIRNVFIGKDGVPRLNLRFIDGQAPDGLIQTAGLSPKEL